MDFDLELIAPAAELTAFARQVPVRGDFTLTTEILPQRRIRNVKYKTRSGSTTISAAKYRAFSAPVERLRTSGKLRVREGYLPALGGSQEIEELQAILLEISRGADSTGMLDQLYTNVQNQALSIHARLEIAAGEALSEGAISIEENGVDLTLDFGVPGSNRVAPATSWLNPLATRLQDEVNWVGVLADAGFAPGLALTSRRVIQGYAANASYKAARYGLSEADAASRPALSAEEINTVRANYGLPPMRAYDVRVDVDGVMQRVLPENALIYVPADRSTLGSTTYGLTAESLVLSSGTNPRIEAEEASGIISSSQYRHNPVVIETVTNAVALPLLDEPNAILIAKVWP